MNELLNKAECSAMRGMAILGIVLHNFCHWLGPMVKENEYTFSAHNNNRLLFELQHPDEMLPLHLLSYFGHYGVPVFLFLSGWGLVMKYEQPITSQPQSDLPLWRFVRYNYLKLLRLLLVGFVLFAMVDWMTRAPHVWQWNHVVSLLLMFGNVLPEPNHIIWPGPYWFFGLMMEFYIVYRLLLYRRHWGFTVALVALCWLSQVLVADDASWLNRLRYNFIGGMLPFGMGLLMAKGARGRLTPDCLLPKGCKKGRLLALLALVVCCLLVLVMSFSFHSWLWAPAFVVLGAVAFVKLLPDWLLQWLVWVGGVSAAMFVAHPVTRKLFLPLTRQGDAYGGLLVYLVTTVCLAWAVQQVVARIPRPRL